MDTSEFNACKKQLCEGLDTLAISLSDSQIQLLLAYLQQFYQWNQAYNLSAVREPQQMVSRHLLDSLTLVPYIRAAIHNHSTPVRLIDVGSGGGLPGVPLAIACPELDVTLLDSNGKKARFLFQTQVKLNLVNVKVENNRAEKFSPADKFAIVTSRAFASLQDMVAVTAHLLLDNGEYWAMKGAYPESELAACSGVSLKAAQVLTVPGSQSQRHLIILRAC